MLPSSPWVLEREEKKESGRWKSGNRRRRFPKGGGSGGKPGVGFPPLPRHRLFHGPRGSGPPHEVHSESRRRRLDADEWSRSGRRACAASGTCQSATNGRQWPPCCPCPRLVRSGWRRSIQIAAPAASKGGALFRRFHAELLVELLDVMLAQKPVGLLQRLDAGQTQFLRQPSLPGPKATLRAPSRLR